MCFSLFRLESDRIQNHFRAIDHGARKALHIVTREAVRSDVRADREVAVWIGVCHAVMAVAAVPIPLNADRVFPDLEFCDLVEIVYRDPVYGFGFVVLQRADERCVDHVRFVLSWLCGFLYSNMVSVFVDYVRENAVFVRFCVDNTDSFSRCEI